MFDYPNEDVKDKHLTRTTITDGWNNLWQKHNVIIQITRPSIVRYDVTQSQFSEEQNPQPVNTATPTAPSNIYLAIASKL